MLIDNFFQIATNIITLTIKLNFFYADVNKVMDLVEMSAFCATFLYTSRINMASPDREKYRGHPIVLFMSSLIKEISAVILEWLMGSN